MRTRRLPFVRNMLCIALLACGTAALAKPGAEPIDEQGAFALGDTLVLPAPDVAKLQMEDAKAQGGPYRYGEPGARHGLIPEPEHEAVPGERTLAD